MRIRPLISFVIGLLLALALVGTATALQAHNSSDLQAWLQVQRHDRLLWMLDGCAVLILLGTTLLGATYSRFQEQLRTQSEENARRLAQLAERTEELFRLNGEHAERIGDLETSGADWHAGFEAEARRLTEQAFLALNDHVDMHTRQLEAIHLAMRYQRAEIKNVRGALRTGELAPETEAPPLLEGASLSGKALPPRQNADEGTNSGVNAPGHGTVDQTVNAGSTLIVDTVEFAIVDSNPDPQEPPAPEAIIPDSAETENPNSADVSRQEPA